MSGSHAGTTTGAASAAGHPAWLPVLVDFGAAVRAGSLTLFRGTPAFAADSLLESRQNRMPVFASASMDFESLCYTLCALWLSSKGEPWCQTIILDDIADMRAQALGSCPPFLCSFLAELRAGKPAGDLRKHFEGH